MNGFAVYDENGNKIDNAGRFAELKSGEAAGFAVLLDKRRIPVRFCVKRKESILELGDVPKRNPAASEARLNGKIMAALLIEAFIAKASFSPGNPIKYPPQYMA